MIKKTITFPDYNGNVITDDFYFNLTKAELIEMEASVEGGLKNTIEKIVKTKDTPSLIKIFKTLILQAYGEKSPDGRRFMKDPELSKAFSQTEAYSQLFMELATDADAASAFIDGIIPEMDEAEKQKAIEQAKKEFNL